MVIEHEAGDLTCTVEASTPMAELQSHVAPDGQMLALDPPDQAALTVGEVFDRALFGPRAHRYGLPRDLVLGVRVRLAGGNLIRGGGKVVKNVAGYDLPKAVHGCRGTARRAAQTTLRLPAARLDLHRRHRAVSPRPLEQLAPACVEYTWPDGRMLVRFEPRGGGGWPRQPASWWAASWSSTRGAVGRTPAPARRARSCTAVHLPMRHRSASGCEPPEQPGSSAAGRVAGCSPDVPADRRPLSPLGNG
jgi:hypothetical protein